MKHQETVREFYRRQGEERERQRILKLVKAFERNLPGTPITAFTLELLLLKSEVEDARL